MNFKYNSFDSVLQSQPCLKGSFLDAKAIATCKVCISHINRHKTKKKMIEKKSYHHKCPQAC